MANTTTRTWNINAVKTLVYGGAKEGTEKCAEHLLAVSQALTPIRSGRLVSSGDIKETNSGYTVSYSIDSLSDSDFDYAILQHEEKGFRHRIGQAKYLEEPAKEYATMYKQWIAEAVDRRL